MAYSIPCLTYSLCLLLMLGGGACRTTQELAARASTIPAPIVIPASQNFEGNDGPWSTFTLQVGTPAQDVRVMISTTGYQTWVVVPQGCPSSEPFNCAQMRGGLFHYNQSSTWVQNNVTSNGTFHLALEENLGYTGNGLYGYDTIALGWQGSNGPSLDQQIVAGIATPDFYYGVFGLDPRPTNFTDFNNPVPSYLSNLRKQNLIPSLSWGYTAGNQYRENPVLGSLTLGGYDTSRFQSNPAAFPFNDQDIRALTVQLASITHTVNSSKTTLLAVPISVFIDSTIPWIYLPVDVCEKFEEAFGISWDAQSQAYLVNDTLHASLRSNNATVTFALQDPGGSGLVEIALPYAAFDLIAEYPMAPNPTRYFPLARATNSSQYTLGRTFFQEAYVTVDYERRIFRVSQCTWDPNAQQSIEAISSLSLPQVSTYSKPHHISGGAIAGIVVGTVIGIVIIVTLGYFLYKQFTPSHQPRHQETDSSEKAGIDSSQRFPPELVGDRFAGQELDGQQHLGTEIDGKHLPGHEMDGKRILGREVDSDDKIRHELNSGQNRSAEMPAREIPAAELP